MSLRPKSQQRRQRWTRGYPPLILLAVAVLAVVVVLPSSLNLPQSNPTTVLEYAPVPPSDENQPPPQGNTSALSLSTSNTLSLPAPGGSVPGPGKLLQGIGGRPNQKRCVGNPPRQTEDPASPPCVPFFEGNNFGATYRGVTKNEVTVLVYYDVGAYGLAGQLETTPAPGTYVDIDKPRLPNCPPDQGQGGYTDPNQCDHLLVRVLKGFSRYFNSRFQTYNRHVHYWAFFGNQSGVSEASRRGDAVANVERLKPFAVIDQATFGGFNDAYDNAIAQQGVLIFSSQQGSLPNATYRKNAPLSWGFYPDVEHWAALYTTYVCQKVAPYPVRRFNGGGGAPNGAKRKYGLWYTTDPASPELRFFAEIVKDGVKKQCGVTGIDATHQYNGFAVDNHDTATDAANAAAKFQTNNVTTILYLGSIEGKLSQALDSIKYYPEIVIAGNLDNDSNFNGQVQNQTAWRNAWAMTFHVRISRLQDAPGFRAYKEGDPSGDENAGTWARDEYRDNFMFFQGIQVAGPRLTPESMNKGFHAIPEHSSKNPFSPALYFDPGDYTSLKDGAEEWWDPQGQSPPGGTPSRRPGCFRMTRNGQRFTAGNWPRSDDVFRNGTGDPCTGYGGSIQVRYDPDV